MLYYSSIHSFDINCTKSCIAKLGNPFQQDIEQFRRFILFGRIIIDAPYLCFTDTFYEKSAGSYFQANAIYYFICYGKVIQSSYHAATLFNRSQKELRHKCWNSSKVSCVSFQLHCTVPDRALLVQSALTDGCPCLRPCISAHHLRKHLPSWQ